LQAVSKFRTSCCSLDDLVLSLADREAPLTTRERPEDGRQTTQTPPHPIERSGAEVQQHPVVGAFPVDRNSRGHAGRDECSLVRPLTLNH